MDRHCNRIWETGVADARRFIEEVDASATRTGARRTRAETGGAEPLPAPWSPAQCAALREHIRKDNPTHALRAALGSTPLSAPAPARPVLERGLQWWAEQLLAGYGLELHALPPDFAASALEDPAQSALLNGRRVSRDFLRQLWLLLEIAMHAELGEAPRMLQLGAGYGALPRLFKLNYPDACCVLTDAPEALYFASMYLRTSFPEARCYYVTTPQPEGIPVTGYDFVFVPTQFARDLAGHFDVFVNDGAFGALPAGGVCSWLSLLQEHLEVQQVLSLDRYLQPAGASAHSQRADGPPQWVPRSAAGSASTGLDPYWDIQRFAVEPSALRCPHYATEDARMLLLAGTRVPVSERNAVASRARGQQLCAALAGEEWFWQIARDEPIAFRHSDLEHGGTLHRLWEAVRLDPGADSHALMLIYLHALMGERPFEELVHYADRYAALADDRRQVALLPRHEAILAGLTECPRDAQYAARVQAHIAAAWAPAAPVRSIPCRPRRPGPPAHHALDLKQNVG